MDYTKGGPFHGYKLLLVEDDSTIVEGLEYYLTEEGFLLTCCYTKVSALEVLSKQKFDLAILDISLPDGSGYDLCKEIKETSETPVIFLTARDDEGSTVMGLDMGADDYITKPFRIRELHSRIKSVLRRSGKGNSDNDTEIMEVEGITVNLREAKVLKNGDDIYLTALEYRLFLILLHNQGRVLTRDQLLENIWDVSGDFVNDNTLTVYIKRLRDKVEDDPQNPTIIKTIRGMGYQV